MILFFYLCRFFPVTCYTFSVMLFLLPLFVLVESLKHWSLKFNDYKVVQGLSIFLISQIFSF